MAGTIERNSSNLHDQDTGLLTGYKNPVTGKTEALDAASLAQANIARGCTWATIGDPAAYAGGFATVSDVGVTPSLWYSNGVAWDNTHPIVLYRRGDRVASITSGTAETNLLNFEVFGGLLAGHREIQFSHAISYTASVNSKFIRSRLNATATGLAGTATTEFTRAGASAVYDARTETLRARGSSSAQWWLTSDNLVQQNTNFQTAQAISTGSNWFYSLTGRTATGGEVIHLETASIVLV